MYVESRPQVIRQVNLEEVELLNRNRYLLYSKFELLNYHADMENQQNVVAIKFFTLSSNCVILTLSLEVYCQFEYQLDD